MLFSINEIFLYALIQYNEYIISIVDTDELVPYHQGTRSYSHSCLSSYGLSTLLKWKLPSDVHTNKRQLKETMQC